jgi:hypothetical protein
MVKQYMRTIWIVLLLGAVFGATPTFAQEQPGSGTGEESPVEPAAEEAADEELPEIDVWAEDADADDDVFIPTESISADSSIAFPSDI